ncbi:unnamed protein product [Zymoseptoria tritici ST99CH_1A5]|uniref:Uncharacterized protein n=2 Tax=Zymoseptoria tritici TaxID=1047171 RepID=A0A2H1GY76_ZYMTR|nr:unnamed protein product [Zymoseptoria tritici ST99CH_1E4]SMY27726.1 unnamed protein product [Zymoseptoria tritici ST99CH_1A5]
MEDNFRTWFFKFPNGPDRFRVTHFANAGADSNVSSSLERRFTVFANGTQQTRSNVNGICEPRDGQRRIIRYASSPHRLSALEIRTGLKMLPQELRDQIQDLTFTVDWICREEKDITQQDMNILQIDHASRSRLAPLFFAGGLRLEWQGPSFGLQCWLESFPAAFKPLIDNFDCRKLEDVLMRRLLRSVFCAGDWEWNGRVCVTFTDDGLALRGEVDLLTE